MNNLPLPTPFLFSASFVIITSPVGSTVIGPIMDYIGRKWSLILVCVPYIISSLLTILADPGNIELLYLSKICAGIGGGKIYVSSFNSLFFFSFSINLLLERGSFNPVPVISYDGREEMRYCPLAYMKGPGRNKTP
jgi:Sugar (and other) transporter.